jgi:protein ImuB
LAEALAALALAYGSRACRIAEVDHDDPRTDRERLEGIGRWCRRFAPVVAIEESDHPECIQVDITDTAALFGGEESVVRTAVWTLAAKGFHARAAVADTPSAAWAAAHHTSEETAGPGGGGCSGRRASGGRPRRWRIVAPGRQAVELAGLSLPALRIPPDDIGRLAEIGVTTIGGLLRLPVAGLMARFSPQLRRRLGQFRGDLAEPLEGIRGEALPAADCRLDGPCATLGTIRGSVEALVGACMASLAPRGLGVTMLQVRLEPSGHGPPTVVDVGLFRPSCSVRHLAELVELRLSRVRLPGEVEGIAVEVIAAAAVDFRQRSLFGADAPVGADSRVEAMLERLCGRLGRAAVFEPQPVADPQPEHAWVATPLLGGHAAGGRRPSVSRTGEISSARAFPESSGSRLLPKSWGSQSVPRPIRLLPQPIRLEMVSVVPDGPPVRFRIGAVGRRLPGGMPPGTRPEVSGITGSEVLWVADSWGPERIETAWWRGGTVRRDYYVVELKTGGRLWLFRRLRDGVWFLHGQFA